jgi:uncharacterized YceG family protein
VSGGYGAGGRGGAGRGRGGYGEPGYGDEDYGGQGYGGDGRDAGGQPGARPSWDDPYWQQAQSDGRAGLDPAQGAGYGPGYGQPGGWPDPRAQGQRPDGGPQQYDPRTGPQPAPRGGEWQPGQRGSTGPRPVQRGNGQQQVPDYGTGPRPAQRGTGQARQAPRGYDPRGAAPRRASDGYPGEGTPGDGYPGGYQARGDGRFGQQGYEGRNPEPRDDSFVPGFGRRDQFDGGRGPGRAPGAPGALGAPGAPGGRYAGEPGFYGEDEYADDRRGRRAGPGRGGGRDGWDDGGGRRRRGPIRRLAPWIALLVILTPLVIGGLYVYHLYENKVHPADYSGPGIAPAVTVQVKNGDTAFTLGPRLQALGVIASARAFELAAEASANSTGLEAGFFKLNHHMQASLAWAALLNPKNRVQLVVTIPEGKRTSQIILLLAKATSIPAADFQKVVSNPAGLGLPSYAGGKVEGYLFPATYDIQPGETALQILQAMVQRFDVEAQQVNLVSAARNVGLTSAQVIIEASMAQAEGGSVSDYPKIARVIINRLRNGMHLEFDSTVLYGLGKYAVSATIPETKIPGPYNTYLNAGLPVGPICNPGDLAIRAILHPATGNWLYFITRPGGKSEFSPTPLTGQ